MGRVFRIKMVGELYYCKFCNAHLVLHKDNSFRWYYTGYGSTFFFNNAVNVTTLGDEEIHLSPDRKHIVVDIYCIDCHSFLGWIPKSTNDDKKEEFKERRVIVVRDNILGPTDSTGQYVQTLGRFTVTETA